MESRQGHGSRTVQYSSIPKPPSTTSSSNDSKTHRRQRSEPSTSLKQTQPPTTGAIKSTTNINNSSSGVGSSTQSHKDLQTKSSTLSRTSQSSKPTSSLHRQTERATITASNSSPFALSSHTPDGGSLSPTSHSQPSQIRPKSSEPHSRSKRNEYFATNKHSSDHYQRAGDNGDKSDRKSMSSSKEEYDKKSDYSRDRSDKSDIKKKESSTRSSKHSSSKPPDDQELFDSKSKDVKKGKPSHTPKIKRRPRSSSSSRQSSSDDGGNKRRERHSNFIEKDVDSSRQSTTSSSSCYDASLSSRLLPDTPTSSSNTYDKITPKEQESRMSYANARDADTRSVKSEKSARSKRATSAPRELRPVNGRERYVDEERMSQSKGSMSYHQLPKSMATSMQNSSSKKHKSLLDVSEKQKSNEEEISMTDLNSTQLEKFKHHRHQHQTLKSSSSVPNSSDSSKMYCSSRSDKELSSSRSPKNVSRKHSRQNSDVELKSDSERSNRGPSVSSAEEPLLPKGHTSSKHNSDSRSNRKTLPTPNVQTFPRMKNQKDSPKKPSQMYPVSTSTVDRHQTGKTQFLLDRIRNFSSNQISSEEPYFSPLHRIPSQSSLSSDNRSEVCLDLPDTPEDTDEYYNTGLKNNINIKSSFPVAVYEPISPMVQRSICKSTVIHFFKFLISFILVWPLLVIIIVLVPLVYIIKKFFSWCCCCGRDLWGRCCVCLCHTHLTSSELIWMGRGSRSNPVVQSLVVIQRGLDTERIRHLIDSRILFVENRRGRKLYPRFTQRVVKFCCGQAWVSDRSFVTANHVHNMPGYIETLDDLQQFISKMASEPLPSNRPLWEVQVLHNFREPRDTVLLFRMHMAMTDGVSMVHVLQHALVDSTKPSSTKTTFSDEAANTSPFKVMLAGPLTFLSRYVFRRDDFNLLHGGHFQTSGESVVAWSEPFSLSAALRVKQVARCTLTDLLLSITAGNIRTYLQVCGVRHPSNVTCAVPVDFQSMDVGALDMENKYTLVHIPLPTNTEGAIPRLWVVKRIMEKFKGTAEAAIVSGARWLAYSLLPVPCFQRMWQKVYSRCTLLVSNLAGPTSVLKLDSREIKCMMYWVPPLDRVAVTVSFFTYADQIRMSVISDRSALPNPELLTRDFIYKLETLSKLLAHRRIPGESSYHSRHDNVHLLSSFTLDDLTAEQIQLEMSLVQQELHDLKIQLDAGPTDHISHNDHQLMDRIEALKERSSELMMQLRKRKAEEAECAVILSEEAEDLSLENLDTHSRPFRRRTLSMSSRMSTTSASSTARPLSTASTSNLTTSNHPSPTHNSLPSWPECDTGMEDIHEDPSNMRRPQTLHRFPHRPDPELDSPERQAYRSSSQHLLHPTTTTTSSSTPTNNPNSNQPKSYSSSSHNS